MKKAWRLFLWWVAVFITALNATYLYHIIKPDEPVAVEIKCNEEILNLQRDIIRVEIDLLEQYIVLQTLDMWRKSVLEPNQRLTDHEKLYLRNAFEENYNGHAQTD